VTDLDPWYEAREAMRTALAEDLLGSADDRILEEPPLDRFIVGILRPASDELIEDSGAVPEEESGTAIDGGYDPGVDLSRMRYPSSMGLTFAVVPDESPTVVLRAAADRYVPEVGAGATGRTTAPVRWNLVTGDEIECTVDASVTGPAIHAVATGLTLRVLVREPVDGVVGITAVLVNEFPRPASGPVDEWCWFRPKIVATAPVGRFSERVTRRRGGGDLDDAASDLLFRDKTSISVGHGCAVDWDDAGALNCLATTFLPHHDLRVSRAERRDVPPLGMTTLAGTDDRSALRGLLHAYEAWISEQEERLDTIDEDFRDVARRHLQDARTAAGRIGGGIDLLDRDPDASRAFRVMNRVMQEQRARQEMIRGHLPAPDPTEQHWRPFQLAFILLSLSGIAEPESDEREVADLLWFPTGGGKTEAYLGLIAFTLALRRLRMTKGAGGGVAVIMRYTLRLLTLQQFERAAGLICALEEWRRHEVSASAPISIGLWVGQSATPNRVDAARRALRKQESGELSDDDGNPRQLLRCPWCGTALPGSAYDADVRADRMTVRCPGPGCPFGDGLPVHVVDTDVYRERPSLLIGTVDKFALLAWEERAGRIFGTDGAVEPPDLVVQDELHLISGPLGTLVGLYEMAVDAAATGAARPKLVASTATIRRARDQVKAVFDREPQQFPPPGIEPEDSFFAVEAPPEELPTRQYVGVMAPGTSHATLLVRSYAALLQGAERLAAPPEVRDAYWTLLGYFNSLRVLGAAYMQSIDDVPDRIGVVAGRYAEEPRELSTPRELTSRVRSGQVPEELDRLASPVGTPECPDIVLATNMISVGVDVNRLGLMVVMGQPQTTSEYIQSTSRVGRLRPGLVVTLYNAARTRDLSHYESFVPYHRALYRQVEATGATPFAPRAVDRGLHGVVVALTRLLHQQAASDKSVGAGVDPEIIKHVTDVIGRRVLSVDGRRAASVLDALEALHDHWQDGLRDGKVTKYVAWRAPTEGALIRPAGGDVGGGESLTLAFPVTEPAWPTLTSLRNVDAESTLYLLRRSKSRG